MPQQMPLGVSKQDEATFSNFYLPPGDSNRQVVDFLQNFAAGDNLEPVIYLWGPIGSGVTHLLQAVCQVAASHKRSYCYLPLKDNIDTDPTSAFDHLEQLELICIDDVHLLSHRSTWQVALFHLYNRLKDSGRQLLLGACQSPRGLDITLNDLRSRLQWGLIFQLCPLSDRDKIIVLRQRSRQRGFDLPEEVAHYILHRAPRNTRALFSYLEQLDHASLMAQRKITIPFVKRVLDFGS